MYEYFLSKFALAEGKCKGEFYTLKCIVNLIAEMIEPYDGILYEKKYIELTETDRARVTEVYHNCQQAGYEETYQNVPEFCYSASYAEADK